MVEPIIDKIQWQKQVMIIVENYHNLVEGMFDNVSDGPQLLQFARKECYEQLEGLGVKNIKELLSE